jgi:threonine dehydrogenase-like Zn-dependent dehydrogenase
LHAALAGDGRLGLLIAQVLALKAPGRVTHFGRHADKMALVAGMAAQVVVHEATAAEHAGAFGLVVEASGAPAERVTAVQHFAAAAAAGTLAELALLVQHINTQDRCVDLPCEQYMQLSNHSSCDGCFKDRILQQ